MTETLSIEASIEELDGIARSLDRVAARIEAGDVDESLDEMVEGLERAESRIAGLVAKAESCERLADSRLIALKSDWLARFERLFGLVDRTRRQLDGEAGFRLNQHRAADAYLKNQPF